MDIAIWLQQVGLSQYATAFRDNDVDFRILRGLTGDDLREIGVLSVGHRRLLMQAIGRLAEAPAVPRRGASVEPGGAEGAPAASAERRRLTVMFVDLVGSTMLMRRHDPEDVRDILHRYQGLVAGEIARVEGYLAKFMGDGVLAYFGWPRAHEDDAERAVRAGLAITNAIAQMRLLDGECLACRIGIATGPVVVGDLVGEGRSREEAVVGDTPNLAARLQALAPANGVLLSHATRQLVGRLFTLVPLENVELKGFEATQTAWRVVGEARSRSRFEARQGATASPMVGRDQELALLRERWAQARQGEGQAVLLVGEAGIGKSRLVEALRNDIGSEARLVHWQASPLHRATSLRPVMEDLVEHDKAATAETLEARLMESGVDLQQAVPLLSAHAGISLSAAYPPLEIASEAQRPKLLQMLLQHFLGLAKRQPLLLLFEDTHWADATTLELTRLLLQRLTKGAVLLVITSRPENLPALESQSHLTRLTLNRLSRSAVAEIVMRLIPENRAAGLVETIVSRTDGVPLFVEELSKAIAEREGEQAADETELDVPASLHDTLMARLDRLPTAKELAQLAACIGREIDHRLLRSVADYPEAELTQQLAELCDAELLFRHGTPPDLSYSFKHALVRDAAYESQLKSTRRATHGRILAALERGMVEAEGERLGYHAAGAGLWGKALHYYGSAGKAAFSRASNEEGLALVAKAFESGERLHGDRDAAVAMIDLRTARGWAYLSIGETQRMLEELSEAEASAAGLGLTQLTCQLRTQRTHVESIFGESAERALEHGSAALDLAERVGDPNLLSAVRFVLGHASLVAGDYRAAIEYLEVDAEASQQGLRMAGVGSSGTLAVDILACLGDAHAQLGQWAAAWRRGAEARAVALESGSPWDMVVANYHQTRALLAAGDTDAALPLIDQSIEYCNRAGLRFGRPWHLANLGEVHRMNGRPDEAIPLLDRAISDCAELGLKYPRGHAHLSKAGACIDGQRPDAVSVTEEALAFAKSHHHQAFEVAALELLAAISTPELAAQHLGNARGIAEALGLSLDLAKMDEMQIQPTPVRTSLE